jgi:hypothetical protein
VCQRRLLWVDGRLRLRANLLRHRLHVQLQCPRRVWPVFRAAGQDVPVEYLLQPVWLLRDNPGKLLFSPAKTLPLTINLGLLHEWLPVQLCSQPFAARVSSGAGT